jgi:hypothetical protein
LLILFLLYFIKWYLDSLQLFCIFTICTLLYYFVLNFTDTNWQYNLKFDIPCSLHNWKETSIRYTKNRGKK